MTDIHNTIAQRVPFDPGRPDLIAHTISQEGIAKFEPTHGGFSFWLKDIPTEISIVLSINGVRGGFNFHTSHAIKTPLQDGPYRPSRPWGDDAAYALHLAVTSITQHYRDAVASGLMPSPNWLVANPKTVNGSSET